MVGNSPKMVPGPGVGIRFFYFHGSVLTPRGPKLPGGPPFSLRANAPKRGFPFPNWFRAGRHKVCAGEFIFFDPCIFLGRWKFSHGGNSQTILGVEILCRVTLGFGSRGLDPLGGGSF